MFDGIDVYAVAAAGPDTLPNYPPSAWLEGENVAVPGDGRQRAVPPRPRRTG